jgi:DNA-binding PadR family transcriptional regulator
MTAAGGSRRSLTPIALTTLEMLHERPMHPYEIHQTMLERHADRLFRLTPGTLYHTIERLDRDGLVEVVETSREGRRPERTTYRVTGRGSDALAQRLRSMLAKPVQEYSEAMVAIGLLHTLEPGDGRNQLANRLIALESQIAAQQVWIDNVLALGVPRMYWLDLELRQVAQVAEREWLAGVLDRLDSGELPWPPRSDVQEGLRLVRSPDEHGNTDTNESARGGQEGVG